MTVETEHYGTEQDTTQEPATIGHAKTPLFSSKGLSDPDPTEPSEDEPAPVDPHEVRARITCRGSVNGIELDAGTGVVFIPQYALPDLRRRLLMAQDRLTVASPTPRVRKRRGPTGR
ncbi:hypothetical protein [Kocuria sp. cx-455]|uniref:hypothetical protein n=1 Tax=Kocuria sp. cx-455 TaxID=2771377 RepID=UPI003D72E4BA